MEWVKTTQKSVPLFSRYIATKFSLGKYIVKTNLHNFKINRYKYINDDNHVQAFFSKAELDKLYPLLWNAVVSGKINDFLKDYKNCGLELLNFCKIIQHRNLGKLSNLEINNLFGEWVQEYTKFFGYIYNGNFCVNIVTKKLLEALHKESEDEEFRILIEPSEETYIKKRQKHILSFLKTFDNSNKPFFNLSSLKSSLSLESRDKLIDIHETFRYLGSIFLTTNNYPYLDDFLEEIKSLSTLKREPEDLQKRKSEIIEKLNPSEEIKRWINELTKLAYYRTEVLSYVQKAEYYSVGLFEEIAKRLNISYNQLVHMTDDEIEISLSEGELIIPVEKIESRFENYYVELTNGEVKLSLPEKEVKEEQRILELKGTCASQGKAIGEVRILRNSFEISKMKQGEVLVTFMTTPDYIMAMRKAVAIVTNDGGLTCHAAIVSRELGVPCVVGTEMATRVLKDGDLVEVDATNGLIKKIKE